WEKARRKIYPILRNQLGHDFAGYKPNTFARRVQRRMHVTHAASLDAYVERLKSDPAEVSALFRDLLINVTGFFRDKSAFEALAKAVIPEIFAGRGAQDTVRVWVPGCATGEEVYSIAILAREFMDGLTAIPRVQIFATDIDEHALSVARAGRYPREALEGVTAERRRRFFHPDAAGFVIAKEIRELCVFSPHSVIRDPPFSRVDLISCRNLLIYFGLDSQNQVIPIFHYALRPRGFLFLGASENVSQFGELFAAVDKKHRIYKARDGAGSRLRLAGLMGPQRTDFRAEAVARAATTAGTSLRDQINAQVLGEFAPAHVVVGRDGDVVYYSTKTGKYLEAAPGSPSRQLLTMVRKGLRLDVRSALRECVESGARIVRPGLLSEGPDGQTQLVTLTIEPVSGRNGEEPLYLLLFADQGPPGTEAEAISRLRSSADGASERLEAELRETRERLQSLIEEYETALEELKSSNEELVSVNEELQSTNEEMEASKEEMQSLNEELQTVNAELHGKVDALDAANADLQNLFESTQVATIFLDRDLAIRSYTPAVGQLFNILPTDRGRPITDLASRIPLPGLADDIAQVLADGQRLERRMEQAQTSYLLRVAPYRDSSARNEGVVVTLVDVTSLTQAEAHLQVMIAELNHRVKNMLTVAIAITSETHKGARTVTEFRVSLIDRLHAMARSYELLSRENWIGASIDELVRQQLAPFGLERVTFGGPPVKLKPRQALSVGMVLHELATNASKYGAFSADAGKVDLAWTQVDGEIRLDWREHGGPATGEPPRRGFGLKLVEREAAHNLGGEVKIEFPSAGARASVAFPVASD
ncbi:MAG TPA: CheR family methyltransferase, partial [Caulobacteraceae bacterium]